MSNPAESPMSAVLTPGARVVFLQPHLGYPHLVPVGTTGTVTRGPQLSSGKGAGIRVGVRLDEPHPDDPPGNPRIYAVDPAALALLPTTVDDAKLAVVNAELDAVLRMAAKTNARRAVLDRARNQALANGNKARPGSAGLRGFSWPTDAGWSATPPADLAELPENAEERIDT